MHKVVREGIGSVSFIRFICTTFRSITLITALARGRNVSIHAFLGGWLLVLSGAKTLSGAKHLSYPTFAYQGNYNVTKVIVGEL